MKLIEYLGDPAVRGLYVDALIAGLCVVVMCGLLSVLVVVKRLGFVGQGVSHSAFGGIGVAAVIAALGLAGASAGPVQLAIVALFCVLAALGMAAVSNRRTVPVDTAIGMFLAGSMALGAVLVQWARTLAQSRGTASSVQSWESILFGSILVIEPSDLLAGVIVCVLVVAVLWWIRRPLIFWAFDEDSARAFGVPAGRIKHLLMVLLALAVVIAMKLAGVVLATALLVLPGAIALRLSDRLRTVLVLSVLSGVLGLVGGLITSIELDWQPGPSVVLVLTALFVLALAWARLAGPRSPLPSADTGVPS